MRGRGKHLMKFGVSLLVAVGLVAVGIYVVRGRERSTPARATDVAHSPAPQANKPPPVFDAGNGVVVVSAWHNLLDEPPKVVPEPLAGDAAGWIAQVIPKGVVLGQTREAVFTSLLPAQSRKLPKEFWKESWILPSVLVPGKSEPVRRLLEAKDGVAMRVSLDFRRDLVRPKRADLVSLLVRAGVPSQKFGEKLGGGEGLPHFEVFCGLPGQPGRNAVVIRYSEGEVHSLIFVGGSEGNCPMAAKETESLEYILQMSAGDGGQLFWP